MSAMRVFMIACIVILSSSDASQRPARKPRRPDAGIVPQLVNAVGFTRLLGGAPAP
jgi:hypothetical protein